ncbi:hypothetical protein [Planctomycetes bacterium TBK1r]|uniref:Replication initiator protein A n=1 Tax=Stieleria magnilauensis TaxID=2527963 RepID=A0ABX5XPM8_9BACT|nr:hypothetical protein TBK1r_27280 [Planctomycetes bacterium TBK1r]
MARSSEQPKARRIGFGQLSLVEHSLCPLDRQSSLVENLVHHTEYRFSDANRKRRTANARIFCPLGLSASDEIYLWGLLALTLSQPDERSDLIATPHWCLKQLGIVNSGSGRGGEQYRLFRDALRRLSVASYLCDAFYDPVQAEHREVSFHFLSYSLPTDPLSSRAWRLSWDRTFFELAKHGASHLRFDLDLYRNLDPASRRLFLFASKIFHRRATLPQFDLRHLAVDVLGFSADIAAYDLRMKVLRCLKRLDVAGVVRDFQVVRVAKNQYVVNARRGSHFDRDPISGTHGRELQPVLETLVGLGFDTGAARGLLRRYPARLLEEWADITQAKIDRQGLGSFRRSPMAYLVDSVSKAHQGMRTPPDWWHDLRREESKRASLTDESQKVFDQIRSELFSGASDESTESTKGVAAVGDILKTIR